MRTTPDIPLSYMVYYSRSDGVDGVVEVSEYCLRL